MRGRRRDAGGRCLGTFDHLSLGQRVPWAPFGWLCCPSQQRQPSPLPSPSSDSDPSHQKSKRPSWGCGHWVLPDAQRGKRGVGRGMLHSLLIPPKSLLNSFSCSLKMDPHHHPAHTPGPGPHFCFLLLRGNWEAEGPGCSGHAGTATDGLPKAARGLQAQDWAGGPDPGVC